MVGHLLIIIDMCLLPHFNLLQNNLYVYLLILGSNILYSNSIQPETDSENDTDEEKRSCCHTNSPSFEIRAILIPCCVNYCPCSNTAGQATNQKPPDFVREEKEENCKLSNCTKKVIITVKMTNMGITHCRNQYVVVDHVYDPSSEHKQRLLYPYVLKIKQEPIMQTYRINKESSVNEKSTELVVNKNDKNYKGCITTGKHPTCEQVQYKEKPVPYSTGFCCSCEDQQLQNELAKFDKEQEILEKTVDRQNKKENKLSTNKPQKKPKRAMKREESDNSFTEKLGVDEDKNQLLKLEEILDKFKNFGPSTDKSIVDISEKEDARIRKKTENDSEYKKPIEQCNPKCQEEKKKRKEKKCKKKHKDKCKGKSQNECMNESKNKCKNKPKNQCDEEPKSECNEEPKHEYDDEPKNEYDEEPENECPEETVTKCANVKHQCQEEQTQLISPFIHPRGGQDCHNRTCPPGVDLETYQQSTHCLIFSKLWYTVYKLEKPIIYHDITLEIFEKHEDLMGHVVWNDITNGKPLHIGTSKSEDIDSSESVWVGYVAQEPPPHAFGLNSELHRLLVPEPLDACYAGRYPELKGGPHEWLVIPNYMITYDGSRCDKVGVGYQAFVQQPDRCNKPRGTCLRNQPKDLWCHDHQLEEKGKSGCYFLKYYGFLPRSPIRNSSEEDVGQNLTLYFRGAYLNTINIELKTDYNLVLRPHASAVITEVYVDSSNYIKSTVTVKVTNTGLVYGVFHVALTDCPLDMPASFNNIQTRPAKIAPQHQHIFIIEIMCPMPEKKFYCSIEAKNIKAELLAFRRIRFQKNDRCICIWHCVCTCLETDGGLKCQPLPFDHYNAAGFHGGLPVVADYVQFTLIEELMTLLYHLFLTMTLILILMGIMKGIIGIFYKPIGEWGLCSMLGLPKPMRSYHERSLRGREVIYDICGWPIHPDTKKRVRNASMVVEFCINMIFFLIYPLIMINVIVKRMCFMDASDESDKQPCCLCGRKHETGECPSVGILKGFGFYRKNISYSCPGYPKRKRSHTPGRYTSQESVKCSCY